jgi:sterol desaturase/sphingolipid hydroxylase (fatty acid hydroxylase superfamily)
MSNLIIHRFRPDDILRAVDLLLRTLCFGRQQHATEDKVRSYATTAGWMIVNFLAAPICYFAIELLRDAYSLLCIPVLPTSLWDGVPWSLLLLVSVLAKDFVDYWSHRWMHSQWGWPIHAVHHSDTDVNLLTTWRIHFLESVVMDAWAIILLSWMGMPPAIGATAQFLFKLHNAYTHVDVDIEHGPFRYLLASPRFHRWHHADVPEAIGKNLANVVPLYDMIFGTYYVPGRCDAPMGALTDDVPAHEIVAQIALPLARWRRLGWKCLQRVSRALNFGQLRLYFRRH